MRALAEALRFLSVIPVPGKPPKRFDRVLAAYPWAGLILGLLTALGVWLVSPILGVAGCAVTAVVLRIALTGGLHLDGVADLADGPVELREALDQLPPLLKGYIRLGGKVGDGAVIDHEFNTVDVCMVVTTDRLTEKYRRHYRPSGTA